MGLRFLINHSNFSRNDEEDVLTDLSFHDTVVIYGVDSLLQNKA